MKSAIVKDFHLIILEDNHVYGFIAWISDKGSVNQIGIFDMFTGIKQDINFLVPLLSGKMKIDVAKSKLPFSAIIQNSNLHVLNYKNGSFKTYDTII